MDTLPLSTNYCALDDLGGNFEDAMELRNMGSFSDFLNFYKIVVELYMLF